MNIRQCTGLLVALLFVCGTSIAQSVTKALATSVSPSRSSTRGASVSNKNSEQLMTYAQGAAILEELRRIEGLLLSRSSPEAYSPSSLASMNSDRARVKIASDSYAIGRKDAPVVIIEFVDLQCPVCQRFHTINFPRLKADYIDTGKVRFVTRDLPLPMHLYAHDAAEATRCAGEQGKFWEFRDAVLSGGSPPVPEQLVADARKLGLDLDALTRCEQSAQFENDIKGDERVATAAGINGTPTFIIGRMVAGWLDGKILRGNKPYAAFEAVIESTLNPDPVTPAAPQGK